jgi:hypothetical protein
MIKVFVSHSNRDKDIAEKLTDLLKAAFCFRSAEILCTSVPGHKLPAGADTEEELRAKVLDAGILIGIITPASSESSFVLFELGARWGCNRPLIPILAAGFTAGDLREPLKSKNALLGHDQNDMLQLVDNISEILGLRHEPASAYNKYAVALSKACKMAVKKPELKLESQIEENLKVSVRGTQIENDSILQLDYWTSDMIKLQFDFQNVGKKLIKKGDLQIRIAAPGRSNVNNMELLTEDRIDLASLKSMQAAEGHVTYQLPDFPALPPSGWESRTVALSSHDMAFKARQSVNIVLSIANDIGQKEIAFKLKLLPQLRT